MSPQQIKNKIKTFFAMLQNGELKDILKRIKRQTYSNIYFFIVKGDIHLIDFDNLPKGRIDVTLRPYQDTDHKHFQGLPLDDKLLKANIPTCYVAVTNENIPCYRSWFLEPSHNDKILGFFGHDFVKLKDDEFMIENIYTVEEFRKSYLMVVVNNMLFKKAKELGYRWVIGCIGVDNKASLKGANRLGSHPYKLQVTKWRFFRKTTTYIDIPEKVKTQNPALKFPY